MLSKKEKNTLFIVDVIAILIAIAVCIPFHQAKVSPFEITMKFIVAPILVFILFIVNSVVKYENYRPGNKFLIVSSYLPIFMYIQAAFFCGLLVLLRTTQGYSWAGWLASMVVLTTLLIFSILFSHFSNRWLLNFTKNEATVLDVFFVVLFAISTISMKNHVDAHLNFSFQVQSAMFIWIPAVFVVLFGAFHVLRVMYMVSMNEGYKCLSKKELINNWSQKRAEIKAQVEADILYQLYKYAKDELAIEDEIDGFIEDVNEEIAGLLGDKKDLEEEPVVEQEEIQEPVVVQKVVEVIDQEGLAAIEAERVALEVEKAKLEEQHQQYEAEMKRLEQEELALVKKLEIKVEKPKEKVIKSFKPTFEDVLNYVRAMPNVIEKSNEQKKNCRFFIGNKQMLAAVNSSSDYKITFLYDLDEVVDLIVNMPNIVKAKSPNGANWFKLTNKGQYNEEQIYAILKRSYEMVSILEQRKLAEKEKEKQAKLAARNKEKELARKQKEKEAAKLKAQKEKEKEAAKLKAQKEKEAAKLKAQKEKEKDAAKLKAQKEKEKEAARLKAQKEKEAAKLKAQKEKEKEAAKLKAQKEKEAAKLKAQKEKEAAKLKAQKEKEATKGKTQKAKATETPTEETLKEEIKKAVDLQEVNEPVVEPIVQNEEIVASTMEEPVEPAEEKTENKESVEETQVKLLKEIRDLLKVQTEAEKEKDQSESEKKTGKEVA